LTKFVPLTTRPFWTSRQGMMRVANMAFIIPNRAEFLDKRRVLPYDKAIHPMTNLTA
jgi:hypothetical protein